MLITRQATDTLTPVELDVGDELRLILADGTERHVVADDAAAHVANRGTVADGEAARVLAYRVSCTLRIDGQVVQFVRTIPSQENFRPPPRVMGLRIWLDVVDDAFTFLDTSHGVTGGDVRPGRRIRLAIWDERSRICPTLLHPWCPLPEGGLRVEDCYRGEDTWLGPYNGVSAHDGLDINHPAGAPLWTPISIDEHEMFTRVDAGANNNRWRGLHHWPDGSTWVLQAHHVIRLLVPDDGDIPAGTQYAESGGVNPGVTEHSHFAFRVREEGEEYMLDPWLLFWQMYEDRRATTRSW